MNNKLNKVTALAMRIACTLACLAICRPLLALPEDASQPIVVEAGSSELYLDEGLIIHRGSAASPARIIQGSMQIEGAEIRIVRGEDGSLRQVTATGTPARFQQQPAADQELVYASGLTLDYNNNTRVLTLSEQAEFIQAGNTLNGHTIEYDMSSRRANATSNDASGNQVQMVITPEPAGN